MKGSKDVIKGRIEEAAGVLTGNQKLRAKGKKDQAVGQVKNVAEKCVNTAKELAHSIVVKAEATAKKSIAKAKGC